jgi:predicted MFS family arabinose efflux permease
MLPFMMMAVLALLAFLCISHIIPSLTRRPPQSRPNPPSNNPPAGAAAE